MAMQVPGRARFGRRTMGVVGTYANNPQLLLSHLWYLILLFAAIFFVGCVAVASQHNIDPTANKAAGFVAIWSMLVIISTSIYGQLTLTQWRTAFHVGIFLGIVTMLTQFELTLFALFASYSRRTRLDGDGLVASFSFFLFILYGLFTFVLMKNRGLVVQDELRLPPTPSADEAAAVGTEDITFSVKEGTQPVAV